MVVFDVQAEGCHDMSHFFRFTLQRESEALFSNFKLNFVNFVLT